MSERTITLARDEAGTWLLDGAAQAVPEGTTAPVPYLLARAAHTHEPGTTVRVLDGGTSHTVTLRAPRPVPVEGDPATAETAGEGATAAGPARDPKRARIFAGVVAGCVLATGGVIALGAVRGGADSTPAVPARETAWSVPTLTDTAQTVRAAGVVVSVGGGAAQAIRDADGAVLGSTLAGPSSKLTAGSGVVLVSTTTEKKVTDVLTPARPKTKGKPAQPAKTAQRTEATTTGAAIDSAGIHPFSGQAGAVQDIGTVPILAGTPKTGRAYALVWSAGTFTKVTAPGDGLTARAGTDHGIIWTDGKTTIVRTNLAGANPRTTTLTAPSGGREPDQWAYATDEAIGITWKRAAGSSTVLANYDTDGHPAGTVDLAAGERFTPGPVVSSTVEGTRRYWSTSGTESARRIEGTCDGAIPTGSVSWCKTGDHYHGTDGTDLPAGAVPVASTATDLATTTPSTITKLTDRDDDERATP